jgi:hypothetical protein
MPKKVDEADTAMADQEVSIEVIFLVEGNRMRMTIGGSDPIPLTQTPPLSIRAVDDISLALVGYADANDRTYHVLRFIDDDPRRPEDLGSTGIRYDPERPVRPQRISVILLVEGSNITPTLDGKTRPQPLTFAALRGHEIAFGITSGTNTWVACNRSDRCYHLYQSDGAGNWKDLGRVLYKGKPIPCQ